MKLSYARLNKTLIGNNNFDIRKILQNQDIVS